MKVSRKILLALSTLTIGSAFAFTPSVQPVGVGLDLGMHAKSSALSLSDLSSLLHKKYVFTLRDTQSGSLSYSTRGNFRLDREGYIVQSGMRLQGYQEETSLLATGCELSDIHISERLPPLATTTFAATMNLDASSPVVLVAFDPEDSGSYNFRMSSSLFDSLGGNVEAEFYFVKTQLSTWSIYVVVDHQVIGKGTALFDESGQLKSLQGLDDIAYTQPTTGHPQHFSLTLNGTTQFASSFIVRSLLSDGREIVYLKDIKVNDLGMVNVAYTGGVTTIAGKIAVSPIR